MDFTRRNRQSEMENALESEQRDRERQRNLRAESAEAPRTGGQLVKAELLGIHVSIRDGDNADDWEGDSIIK